MFETQEKSVLSKQIYNTLREAILEGRLQPGTRLVETTIAKEMGVSRAPLREAIRELDKDGLVEIKTHRETRVVSFSLKDIQELHLLRVVLESILLQSAAEGLSEEELSFLEDLTMQTHRAAENGDAARLAEVDYGFHKFLCKASNLERLFKIWNDQHQLLHWWFKVMAKSHLDGMISIARDHQLLFEAVNSKDQGTIAQAVFEHIYFSGHAYRKERAEWAQQACESIKLQFFLPPSVTRETG
jgi:DNA-binding GntR family transcriptional regulator